MAIRDRFTTKIVIFVYANFKYDALADQIFNRHNILFLSDVNIDINTTAQFVFVILQHANMLCIELKDVAELDLSFFRLELAFVMNIWVKMLLRLFVFGRSVDLP